MVEKIESMEQFQKLINGDVPVVIDCYADWCGPCRTIAPIFAKLSDEFTQVKFYKLNIDEQEDISNELQIRSIPAFFIFCKGNKIEELVGLTPAHCVPPWTTASSLVA
ncbi:putative thioredoxin [Pisolithus tinctorius]|nr:putative thioredoxin [Pisolithus tinctorius]